MKKTIEKLLGWQFEFHYIVDEPGGYELWREEKGYWRGQLGKYRVFFLSKKHKDFHYR